MNKGLIAAIVLVLALTTTWFFIFSLSGANRCPDELSDDYYYCESSNDCFFHPKYECINQKPLDCFIEEDLSARQELASIMECQCVSNRCITQVRR